MGGRTYPASDISVMGSKNHGFTNPYQEYIIGYELLHKNKNNVIFTDLLQIVQ